ncbi:MAG TPA: DUF2231 domain-containing protein [Candidatus Methylacidiphilales bacterium]|nr:DUF2231 domain-containing protein [Candidatus Methylacidiphilales bacterium]
MSIDPSWWAKIHGASTHFPVALTMSAAFFESLGFVLPGSARAKASLLAAGYYTIILGALGTFPAVLSGLLLTKGEMGGHDALLFHHLFVWPAFTGLIGLGTWRAWVGERFSRRGFLCYLAVLFLVAGLMAGAGYWGGELILDS